MGNEGLIFLVVLGISIPVLLVVLYFSSKTAQSISTSSATSTGFFKSILGRVILRVLVAFILGMALFFIQRLL